MRYYDCPVCGAVESLRIGWHSDSDGDDMHSRSWEYPEIDEAECGCVIPADDCNRILVEVLKEGPFDDES